MLDCGRQAEVAEIVIVPNRSHAGVLVAEAIIDLIRSNPFAVLGLATGSTPMPVYAALAEHAAEVDVSQVCAFALDEYVGLPSSHPESYRSVISREVVEPLDLEPSNVEIPQGSRQPSSRRGESISNCWESGRTDTSASTSPALPLPHRLASRL